MFIVEGLPAIVWAFVFRAMVQDWPQDAAWLDDVERQQTLDRLRQEQEDLHGAPSGYLQAFRSRNVVVLSIQYLLWSIGVYGFVFWLPTILDTLQHKGIGLIGGLSAVPYAFAAIGMVVASRFSDRSGNRREFVWPFLLAATVLFVISVLLGTHHYWVSYAVLIFAGACMYVPYGPYFALIPEFLPQRVSGAAMALVNSAGARAPPRCARVRRRDDRPHRDPGGTRAGGAHSPGGAGGGGALRPRPAAADPISQRPRRGPILAALTRAGAAVRNLLAFTKDLPRLLSDARAHRWDHYAVRELAGQRLLVVGRGHIGRQTAQLARALGMHVTGVRRNPTPDDGELVDRMRRTDELVDAVGDCDAVVLALPDTEHTRGLFGRTAVDALPRHGIVVNVGRGSTVDEEALVAALREHRLAGAALDVFAAEPLREDSPLWELDNVLLSPHTAALSMHENERIVELFMDNLGRFRRGEPLRNVVEPEHFY